jgi:hypothetical protein
LIFRVLGCDARATPYSLHLRVENAQHEPLLPTGDDSDRGDVVVGRVDVLP